MIIITAIPVTILSSPLTRKLGCGHLHKSNITRMPISVCPDARHPSLYRSSYFWQTWLLIHDIFVLGGGQYMMMYSSVARILIVSGPSSPGELQTLALCWFRSSRHRHVITNGCREGGGGRHCFIFCVRFSFFSSFVRRPSRYQLVFWNRRRQIMM